MVNEALCNRLSSLSIHAPQRHRNLTVFPIVGESLAVPAYLMLADALEQNLLTVEEISEGGSVPELFVCNESDCFVLLLDGEEVAGAKQNRVLNTTILIDKRSKTRIPVSCTEQGRWEYSSAKFSHSGTIMSSKLRRRKARSVSDSLKTKKSFASDQGEVWASISELHEDADTQSPTGAMKDAYESRQAQLREYADAISPVDDQVGFIAFIDGKPAGCDLFSTSASFSKVSAELTQSYAMDALTSRQKDDSTAVAHEEAVTFIRSFSDLGEESFDSVGIGKDYRFQGPTISGSALIVGETPVHAAFFSTDGDDKTQPRVRRFSPLSQRRRFRQSDQTDENPGDED